MLTEISKILSFLNPKNWNLKDWAILMIGSALLLWLPAKLLTFTQVKLTSETVFTIIVVLCLSTAGFIINCIYNIIDFCKHKKATAAKKQQSRAYLHKLTLEEKQLLCGYILNGSKTQILQIDDGVVNGLVQAGIIYLAANTGTHEGFAYNIYDWAWEYLAPDNSIITEGISTDQGGFSLYKNNGSPRGQAQNRRRR